MAEDLIEVLVLHDWAVRKGVCDDHGRSELIRALPPGGNRPLIFMHGEENHGDSGAISISEV